VGRISTVAKGARRPRSPFRGKLDLFYLADFSFIRSRRSSLHVLREVSLRETHNELRQELHYLQQAAYCAALIEQATETDTPLPRMFELLAGLLRQLPRGRPQPTTIFAFDLKLLKELGQSPNLPASQLSVGTKQILARITDLDWPVLPRLKASQPQLREMERFLNDFLLFQLGKIPTGRQAALKENGGFLEN
jgi:DNA repair protein RecO (recombination protein O)